MKYTAAREVNVSMVDPLVLIIQALMKYYVKNCAY